MSQLTIQLSDKAVALIAQLQKEIFQRRRKKVSAEGVIETLVESGARSQSDKRFATSWKNLVADIEKAARLADAHGAKPATLSDEEWVLVLSHRSKQASPAPVTVRKAAASRASGKKKASSPRPSPDRTDTPAAARVRTAAAAPAKRPRSSLAKRMAKAVNLLGPGAAADAGPAGATPARGTGSGNGAATGEGVAG